MDTPFTLRADPLAALYGEFDYTAPYSSPLLEWLTPDDRTILDVGCGTGVQASRMRELGRKVHGLTLSETEKQKAEGSLERVTVANVESWVPDYEEGFFDAFLFSHVLEHLINPSFTLRRLTPLLAPGGRVYVALPNVAYWPFRFRALFGRFDYQAMGILDFRHLRFFTFYTAQRLLEGAGFEVSRAEVRGHFPLGPVRRFFPRLALGCDRFVLAWFPNFFGYEILLSAVKKPSV